MGEFDHFLGLVLVGHPEEVELGGLRLVLVIVLLHVPGRNDPFARLGTPSPHKRRRGHNDERRSTNKLKIEKSVENLMKTIMFDSCIS